MATFEDWIPEEYDSSVIQRVNQVSVVEDLGRRYAMGTDTRFVPRSGGVEVGTTQKNAAYDEDDSPNDSVRLTARKVGTSLIRIAEEDLADSNVAILTQKRMDWAVSAAKYFDNACLAVTAEENGGTVPFTSVYRTLSVSDSTVDYTAGDNLVQSATAGYDEISQVLGLAEDSDYWDESRTIVIAHPSFRERMRNIKDNDGHPIFVGGQSDPERGTPDTLFSHPIRWSRGAKTSATAMQNPDGNPLMIVANRDFLALGVRSGPEYLVAPPNTGPAFGSDQALVKMRMRRGFVVSHPKAFAVLELTA